MPRSVNCSHCQEIFFCFDLSPTVLPFLHIIMKWCVTFHLMVFSISFFRCFTERSFSCFNVIIYLRHRLLILYRDQTLLFFFFFLATRWVLHALSRPDKQFSIASQGKLVKCGRLMRSTFEDPQVSRHYFRVAQSIAQFVAPVHFASRCSVWKVAGKESGEIPQLGRLGKSALPSCRVASVASREFCGSLFLIIVLSGFMSCSSATVLQSVECLS